MCLLQSNYSFWNYHSNGKR